MPLAVGNWIINGELLRGVGDSDRFKLMSNKCMQGVLVEFKASKVDRFCILDYVSCVVRVLV